MKENLCETCANAHYKTIDECLTCRDDSNYIQKNSGVFIYLVGSVILCIVIIALIATL